MGALAPVLHAAPKEQEAPAGTQPSANRAPMAHRRGNRRDIPGTIIVRGSSDPADKQRLVVNMLAQYYPGKHRFATDTATLRKQWFQQCLNVIANLTNLQSLAFPYGIGCGAAGGSWPEYRLMICKFAARIPHVRITIYQLPGADTTRQPSLKAFAK
jgi:hypothetical protein